MTETRRDIQQTLLKILICLHLSLNNRQMREIGKERGAEKERKREKKGKGEEGKTRETERERLYVYVLFMKKEICDFVLNCVRLQGIINMLPLDNGILVVHGI